MKVALIAVCIAAMALAASPPTEAYVAEPPSDVWRITPGRSIGPVALWMTQDEVLTAIGQPNEITAEYSWWKYDRYGLAVIFPLEVEKVVLHLHLRGNSTVSTRAQTEEGIGLGSSRDRVIDAFGEPDKTSTNGGNVEVLLYNDRGIWLYLDADRVVELDIVPPKGPRAKRPAA